MKQNTHTSSWYAERLKDPRWQKKRLEILKRDNYKCTSPVCGGGSSVLQVHHMKYTKGDPWDTPDEFLITLCSDCHSKKQDKPLQSFWASSGSRDYSVLNVLVLEFRVSGDPVVFEKILDEVDQLLYWKCHKIIWNHPYLNGEEFDDLYQTSILGLYEALAKIKVGESGSKVIYRIVRKVEDEIFKMYKYRSVWTYDSFIRHKIYCGVMSHNDVPEVYVNLEAEFIQDRFCKLISAGVITTSEFDVLNRHFVEGMSCRDIARQDGRPFASISKEVEDSLNRLRFEFRRRHWEDG